MRAPNTIDDRAAIDFLAAKSFDEFTAIIAAVSAKRWALFDAELMAASGAGEMAAVVSNPKWSAWAHPGERF